MREILYVDKEERKRKSWVSSSRSASPLLAGCEGRMVSSSASAMAGEDVLSRGDCKIRGAGGAFKGVKLISFQKDITPTRGDCGSLCLELESVTPTII